MKLHPSSRNVRRRGFLAVDMAIGAAILALGVIPLAYSVLGERQLLRTTYYRATVAELVDGEAEVLAAGEARSLPDGVQAYNLRVATEQSLPAGRFQLTKTGQHVRLEWLPEKKTGVGAVVREFDLK